MEGEGRGQARERQREPCGAGTVSPAASGASGASGLWAVRGSTPKRLPSGSVQAGLCPSGRHTLTASNRGKHASFWGLGSQPAPRTKQVPACLSVDLVWTAGTGPKGTSHDQLRLRASRDVKCASPPAGPRVGGRARP